MQRSKACRTVVLEREADRKPAGKACLPCEPDSLIRRKPPILQPPLDHPRDRHPLPLIRLDGRHVLRRSGVEKLQKNRHDGRSRLHRFSTVMNISE